MSVGLTAFLFSVVIAVLVLACVLTVYAGRNHVSEKFDERQQIERGNAYRFSHWTGLIYYFGLLVFFVFHTGKSEWTIEPFVLLAIGILIQLDSFHIYCLITHCALPLGEKPMPTIVGYFLMGGVHFAQYFMQHIPEDAALKAGFTGAASHNLFRLLIAFDFCALAVMHLVAMLRKEEA